MVGAHLLAMEEPKASGRLVCSSTVAHWSQIIEMLQSQYPSYPYEKKWVKSWYQLNGLNFMTCNALTIIVLVWYIFLLIFLSSIMVCRCGSQEGDNNTHSMDTTKITQLGFPAFKSLEQMFDDCIKSFQEKGFLWDPWYVMSVYLSCSCEVSLSYDPWGH